MPRMPSGTPYAGPTMNYDQCMNADDLIRRLAYGRAAPLLGDYQRLDGLFYGRLLDALSNSHVALVKVCAEISTAHKTAAKVRKEVHPDAHGVTVDRDPRTGEWVVLAYNQVTARMKEPPLRLEGTRENWITVKEAARILRLSTSHANRLIRDSGVPLIREGGRRQIRVRQSDIPALANRPGRHRRRKKVK